MNLEAMTIADLRDLAGRLDGAANAATDLEAMMGHPVTVNLTAGFALSVPLFPATTPIAKPAPAPIVPEVTAELTTAMAPIPALKPIASRKPLPPPQWNGWTPEEDAVLLGIVRDNPEASDLAIGYTAAPLVPTRTAKAISMRVAGKLRPEVQAIRKAHVAGQGGMIAPTPVAPVAAPAPQPASAPVATKAQADFIPPDDDMPAIRRRLRAHLNGLGYVTPFSAGIDCELVERLAMGEKLPAIADDMGVDAGSMKRRFDALILPLRDERGVIPADAMGTLSKELQAREAYLAERAA